MGTWNAKPPSAVFNTALICAFDAEMSSTGVEEWKETDPARVMNCWAVAALVAAHKAIKKMCLMGSESFNC